MPTAKLRLVIPKAESREPGPTPAKSDWNGDLRGKVVALVDDGRPNGDVTVASIREQLKKEYGVETIDIDKRPLGVIGPAEALPKQLVDKICREADVVISALSS